MKSSKEIILCPECKGLGKIGNSTCMKCEGSGRLLKVISYEIYDSKVDEASKLLANCNDCNDDVDTNYNMKIFMKKR